MTEHMPIFDNQWIALCVMAEETGMAVEDILGEAIYFYVDELKRRRKISDTAMQALEGEYDEYDYAEQYGTLGRY